MAYPWEEQLLSRDLQHFSDLSDKIQIISDEFVRRYNSGELSDEEDTTSRLIERIAQDLKYRSSDFSVESKALTLNKYTEEPKVGADALLILSYRSAEASQTKGVLVQAKRVDASGNMARSEMQRLQQQIQKMLSYTPESYVWTYSKDRFRSYRGYSMSALQTQRPEDLCYTYLPGFFSTFLRCQIGDPTLNFAEFNRLEGIIQELRIPNVLLLSAFSFRDGSGGTSLTDPDAPLDADSIAIRIQEKFDTRQALDERENEQRASVEQQRVLRTEE